MPVETISWLSHFLKRNNDFQLFLGRHNDCETFPAILSSSNGKCHKCRGCYFIISVGFCLSLHCRTKLKPQKKWAHSIHLQQGPRPDSALMQNHKTLNGDLAVTPVFVQTQHKVMSKVKRLSGLFPPRQLIIQAVMAAVELCFAFCTDRLFMVRSKEISFIFIACTKGQAQFQVPSLAEHQGCILSGEHMSVRENRCAGLGSFVGVIC